MFLERIEREHPKSSKTASPVASALQQRVMWTEALCRSFMDLRPTILFYEISPSMPSIPKHASLPRSACAGVEDQAFQQRQHAESLKMLGCTPECIHTAIFIQIGNMLGSFQGSYSIYSRMAAIGRGFRRAASQATQSTAKTGRPAMHS